MGESGGEMLDGVIDIVYAAHFANGVHGELGSADVDGANAGARGEDWTNRGAAASVAANDEFLHGHACALAEFAEHECCDGIRGVALIGVMLDD